MSMNAGALAARAAPSESLVTSRSPQHGSFHRDDPMNGRCVRRADRGRRRDLLHPDRLPGRRRRPAVDAPDPRGGLDAGRLRRPDDLRRGLRRRLPADRRRPARDRLAPAHARPPRPHGRAPGPQPRTASFKVAAPLEDTIWVEAVERQWHDFWDRFPGTLDVSGIKQMQIDDVRRRPPRRSDPARRRRLRGRRPEPRGRAHAWAHARPLRLLRARDRRPLQWRLRAGPRHSLE